MSPDESGKSVRTAFFRGQMSICARRSEARRTLGRAKGGGRRKDGGWRAEESDGGRSRNRAPKRVRTRTALRETPRTTAHTSVLGAKYCHWCQPLTGIGVTSQGICHSAVIYRHSGVSQSLRDTFWLSGKTDFALSVENSGCAMQAEWGANAAPLDGEPRGISASGGRGSGPFVWHGRLCAHHAVSLTGEKSTQTSSDRLALAQKMPCRKSGSCRKCSAYKYLRRISRGESGESVPTLVLHDQMSSCARRSEGRRKGAKGWQKIGGNWRKLAEKMKIDGPASWRKYLVY